MGVLKDKVLCRTRAYNLKQLVSFLTETLPDIYSQNIIDIISGRSVGSSKYKPNEKKFENLQVIETDDQTTVYTVRNSGSNMLYSVNTDIGACSCPVGVSGAPCKHQHFVSKITANSGKSTIPFNEEDREFYHFIATGTKNMLEKWYCPLKKSFQPIDPLESCNTNEEVNDLPVPQTSQSVETTNQPSTSSTHDEGVDTEDMDTNDIPDALNEICNTLK